VTDSRLFNAIRITFKSDFSGSPKLTSLLPRKNLYHLYQFYSEEISVKRIFSLKEEAGSLAKCHLGIYKSYTISSIIYECKRPFPYSPKVDPRDLKS
jgi:hypothetical protein